MLPVPFSAWIPAAYRQGEDPARDAFCARVDELVLGLASEARGLGLVKDPARCPTVMLADLASMLEAGVLDGDPEPVRRRKVATAVRSHRNRSTWDMSVKPLLDSLVGGDATLESSTGSDDFMLVGDGSEPDTYYWSALGGRGGEPYGVRLSGVGTLVGLGHELGDLIEQIKGTVLINVGSPSLTEAQVEYLKLNMRDYAPVYLRVYLGYLTGGAFEPYPNGLL